MCARAHIFSKQNLCLYFNTAASSASIIVDVGLKRKLNLTKAPPSPNPRKIIIIMMITKFQEMCCHVLLHGKFRLALCCFSNFFSLSLSLSHFDASSVHILLGNATID